MLLFLIIFGSFSCESHAGEENDAFENMQTDKLKTGDSASVTAEIIPEPQNIKREDKIKILDEWSQFKSDIEKKISANENGIDEIKAIPFLSKDSFKDVTKLETDNFDLRIQMHKYNDLDTSKLAKFKTKLMREVDDIKFEIELLKIKSRDEVSSNTVSN